MFLTLSVIVFVVTLYTAVYFTRHVLVGRDCDSIEKMGDEHLVTDEYKGMLPFSLKKVKCAISQVCRYKEVYDEEILELIPASNKLFDNLYVFERQYAEIRHNKAEKSLKKVPVIINTNMRGIVRLYVLAKEIIKNPDVLSSQESLIEHIRKYTTKQSITIDEIRLLMLTIKIVLIEKFICLVDRTEYELESKKLAQSLLPKYMEHKSEEVYKEHIGNISFMSYFLYKIDTEETELFENIKSVYSKDIFDTENRRQTELIEEFLQITGAFIELAEINTEKLFLALSPVDAMFQKDPESIYSLLDFETKDYYHSSVSKLSKKLNMSERETGLKVLSMCRKGNDRERYLGYYLFENPDLFIKKMRGVENPKKFNTKSAVFWISVNVTFFLFVVLITLSLQHSNFWLMQFFGFFAFAGAFESNSYIFTMIIKPRVLPSLDYTLGIPKESATGVIMPVIINKKEDIDNHFEKLVKCMLSNLSENLVYILLMDFNDCKEQISVSDEEIRTKASQTVNKLNEEYGDKFICLLRERKWNEKEGKYICWERKRGKIEEFNRLVVNKDSSGFSDVYGNISHLEGLKYIVTIDADTEPFPDSIKKLAGQMSHPLNKPVIDYEKRAVTKGYAIIQPRTNTRMKSAYNTFFSFLFTGQSGIDTYSAPVAELYNDTFEEGIFYGKGIYDPYVFYEILDKRISENAVLSHDLLEGCYLRCAYASNTEFMDSFPSNVFSFYKRDHRWIRGDWQLIPWIFQKNHLSSLSRFKIIDNLRRSLIPIFQVAALLYAALVPENLLVVVITAFFMTFFNLALNIRKTVVSCFKFINGGFRSECVKKTIIFILQSLILITLLPYRAYICFDAIIRTLYRLFVSKKNMLQWQAFDSQDKGRKSFVEYLPLLVVQFLASGLFFYLNNIFWMFFLIGPLTAYLTSINVIRKREKLTVKDMEFLRKTAKDTFAYFAEMTNDRESFLLPDNYQIYPEERRATRTSPTNIGFQILAWVEGYILDFLDESKMLEWLEKLIRTLDELPKHEGHLLNWYDTVSLEPLTPRYVSTVDNGNFACAIIILMELLETFQDNKAHEIKGYFQNMLNNMNFKMLYNYTRDMFHIGYNLETQSHDNSYYDLYASEARLASYIAIAKGDIPKRHWMKLGRPYTRTTSGTSLMSWSGTMFEYILPELFFNSHMASTSGVTVRTVVNEHIRYGRRKKIPWGISESGYYRFDDQLNYQYRAFGIPNISLRSGNEKDKVVSPYSTLMALEYQPLSSMENLYRLKELGMYGKYGFYEAIDYSSDTEGRIIQSFMVHHLGMSLTALCNFLEKDSIRNLFYRNRHINSMEVLLEERCPEGVELEGCVIKKSLDHEIMDEEYAREIRTPVPKYPYVHIISNRKLNEMVSSEGESYLFMGKKSVTRWTNEERDGGNGYFIYIKDLNKNMIWSHAYLPVMKVPEKYSVKLDAGKITYERNDNKTETRTEIFISPYDNVEIRRVTILNKSTEIKEYEVTSALEPVLTAKENDRAHKAFSKLFITTKYIPESNMLTAVRRSREKIHNEECIFHGAYTGNIKENTFLEFETSKEEFLGRGNSYNRPDCIFRGKPFKRTEGTVIDPILSIKKKVRILPGMKESVTFVTGICKNKDEAVKLYENYSIKNNVKRTVITANDSSCINLKHLRINRNLFHGAMILLSSLYYPSRLLRASSDIIEKNTLNQKDLWKYGISGDYPIITFKISDEKETGLLRDTLKAYSLYRKYGIYCDLVILIKESEGYFRPLKYKIDDEVYKVFMYYPGMKQKGIFILNTNHIGEEDTNLILTASAAVISSKRHLTSRRITKMTYEEYTMAVDKIKIERNYQDTPLREEETEFYNGYGGFANSGREYHINVNKDIKTPMPWSNVIANKLLGFLATSEGGGYSYYYNSREYKITVWDNQPVTDSPSEIVYVRDNDTYEITGPALLPFNDAPTRCIHGFGYTEYLKNFMGFNMSMVQFAPLNAPVKITVVKIKNNEPVNRNISVYDYMELVLGENREKERPYLVTSFDNEKNAFICHNIYNDEFKGVKVFVSSTRSITSYTGDRWEFIGRSSTKSDPDGLRKEELSQKCGAGLSPVAAIKTNMVIEPGREYSMAFFMGASKDEEEIASLCSIYSNMDNVNLSLKEVKEYWNDKLGIITVKTDDKALDYLVNGWLLYQTICCRYTARTGYYQSSGAYGFRDQLQDITNIAFLYPEEARNHILRCCMRQMPEGDVLHWWHEPSGKGVRTKIRDDLLWLPYAVCEYIDKIGDYSILDEMAEYISMPLLGERHHELYSIPEQSGIFEDVYNHCKKAILYASQTGQNNLPLIGGGDWNDGMNEIGLKGKGESVWLGWFVLHVVDRFKKIAEYRNDEEFLTFMNKKYYEIKEGINNNGWDGRWYRRAFFDDGEALGSADSIECRIDAISQSWAIISGAAQSDKAIKAYNSLKELLVDRNNRIMPLLSPPFENIEKHPGYIKGYPAGIRENGGQYTHGVIWNAIAACIIGDSEGASEMFDILNPIKNTCTSYKAEKYKTEPYVMTADIYTASNQTGRGGWSWYTGSAGWMYRGLLENYLGFKLKGDTLRIEPVVPETIRYYNIRFRYKSSTYYIEVHNYSAGRKTVYLCDDNVCIMNDCIKLTDDNKIRHIMVKIEKA